MPTRTRQRKSKPRSSDWRKDEIPHCEIDHVAVEDGDIHFYLTPRGGREAERRRKADEAEQKRIKRAIARGDYAIPIGWWLGWDSGPGKYWGK